MRSTLLTAVFATVFLLAPSAFAEYSGDPVYNDDGFHAGAKDLTPSERAGREIWYKATRATTAFTPMSSSSVWGF